MLIFKGDTIQWKMIIKADITNWKIRAELYDKGGSSVKIATANAGGSDEQIVKVKTGTLEDNVFILNFSSGKTTNMDNNVTLEVEVETGNIINDSPEIYTVYQANIELLNQKINWKTLNG